MKAHIIRPAYFRPPRENAADWENQRGAVESVLDRVIAPVFNCVAPSLVTPIPEMQRVALGIAKGQWPDVDLFRNKMIRELASAA